MSTKGQLAIPQTLLIGHSGGQLEEMPLEEYLCGVTGVGLEAGQPAEALRALAIAARSLAVSTRRHARDRFDLCTTPHCQVWRLSDRRDEIDRAVQDTAGLVITRHGRIAVAPVFQQCDGRTRSSEEVWAGAIGYLRSVPCPCGRDHLQGPGVGLCRRGAVAMAQQGLLAEEILRHYYCGVQVEPAIGIPRGQLRWSLILGQVVAQSSSGVRPCDGLRLILNSPDGPVDAAGPTDSQGRFWFTRLPAGEWEIQVLGTSVSRRHVQTDGRNALELEVVLAEAPAQGSSS